MHGNEETSASPRRARALTLAPETWRADLLRIVLRVSTLLGGLAYVPSAYLSAKNGMTGVLVLDTVAVAAIFALRYVARIPAALRAGCTCLVFYALGAGLMVGVGSISQIYLFGFALLTTLLLGFRWGLAAVALNVGTMLTIGFAAMAAPEILVPRSTPDFGGWTVITLNFAFVNVSMVLALGAVLAALETALGRAVASREALAHEQSELVKLNRSLEDEVEERVRNEESLRENRALLRIAGVTARLGGWRIDVAGQRCVWSDEACELYEVAPGATRTVDEALEPFYPECREAMRQAIERCCNDGVPFDVAGEIMTAKGARRWVRSIGNAVRDSAGAITHVHGSVQDITAQRLAETRHDELQEKLRQAQRLESVGSLAAGVAHDFNNLMSIVLSYSELLAADLGPDDPMRADLDEIRGAGNRAVELTRQLLAFSRLQVMAPKLVDLSAIVEGMDPMLRRLIGEDVELTTSCAPGLGRVLVDPGQIEQVIMNLTVNARDAMPRGGTLTITVSEMVLDERYASDHVSVTPGPHVMLSVCDTGTGMDKATQARMFEPFFTTKDKSKGTGLGLATVFGIVQQSGGTLAVHSEPEQGTRFEIYFPIAEGAAAPVVASSGEPRAVGGSETILLVEDEDGVRIVARTVLRKCGYEVLEAKNGADALALCEQHAATTIHLLLTDVVMPRMSGRELAERLLPLRPAMKVLYMSGYTDDSVVRHGVLEAKIAFVQKPITPALLARRVREVLDAEVA